MGSGRAAFQVRGRGLRAFTGHSSRRGFLLQVRRKKNLVQRGGPEKIGAKNTKEAGAEGSGFRSAGLPLGLGSRHGLAGDRRATSVTSPLVSIRADCASSFSCDDLGNSLPRMDPAVQTCER